MGEYRNQAFLKAGAGIVLYQPGVPTEDVGDDKALRISAEIFYTRDQLVEFVDDGNAYDDGYTIIAGGLLYKWQSGATTISDLPGLVPAGDIDVAHWGAAVANSSNHTQFRAAILYANSLGGGDVHVKVPGTYVFTASVYAKPKVRLVCAPGITFQKNFWDNTEGAIIRNESFSTPVDDFEIRGFPVFTSTSLGGKLTFLLGSDMTLETELGVWYAGDNSGTNADGFGITFGGENNNVIARGGDAQETNGQAGVLCFGGSGNVLAINVKAADDALAFNPIAGSAAYSAMTIHDFNFTAINCESSHARIVVAGVADTAAHNASPAEVYNIKGTVIGGGACLEGENAAGTGAVMIINRLTGRTKDMVRNIHIETIGVNCGGQHGARAFSCEDSSIIVRDPTNIAVTASRHGISFADTPNCRFEIYGDLSGASTSALIFSQAGADTDVGLKCDVIAPPGNSPSSLTLIPLGASTAFTRGKLDIKIRELRSNCTAVALSTNTTDVTAEWLEVYIASGATSTVGLSVAAGSVDCQLLGGHLNELATPITNASTTFRMNRDDVIGTWLRGIDSRSNTADFTIFPNTSGEFIELTGTLTANITITLSTSQAIVGERKVIWRSGGDTGGPWTASIVGATTPALSTLQGTELVFTAAGTWRRMG